MSRRREAVEHIAAVQRAVLTSQQWMQTRSEPDRIAARDALTALALRFEEEEPEILSRYEIAAFYAAALTHLHDTAARDDLVRVLMREVLALDASAVTAAT